MTLLSRLLNQASPQDKADNLKNKTELIRKTFNFPDTEYVIQDYACALNKVTPGRVYITANYVVFMGSVSSATEKIALRQVTELKKDYTLFVNNAITFATSSQIISFGTFSHRDEAFSLIYHLWKHPPLFYDPNSALDEKLNSFSNDVMNGREQKQKVMSTKVDTQSTKQALRLAYETKETGIATVNELSYQAEIIDNIERNVEHIHGNLDKSDRLLKGIESFGGAISNAFSKEKVSDLNGFQPRDRSIQIRPRDEPPLEIEILEKLPNDNLIPGFIQFTADKFVILDNNKKPKPDGTFTYDQAESLVVRARPQHLDIRFSGRANRVRMASSYIQNIVNEFVLRSNGKLGRSAKVIFEPGVKEFAYGSATIKYIPSVGRQKTGALFTRASTLGVSNVIKNAPEDVKNAMLEQDKDLDEISNLLGDIHGIAKAIGEEVDRSSEQLDRITTRVDYANERLYNNNKRIEKML
eukprot:gene7898-9717_t